MSQEPPANNSNKLAYETPDDERPASATPPEPALDALAHDPYAALRYPVYRLFMGNYALAVIGSQVMSVAIQWELAEQTNSKLILGLLGGLQALPVILLALVAGHVSDAFSRKNVLLVTQVALVICPVALAMLMQYSHGSPHYLAIAFAIILINSVALTFARPARQSLLPQLVPADVFSNAVTWNATFFETASISGPGIGGWIIAQWSVQGALLFSAVCTAICLFLTALLPPIPAASQKESISVKSLIAGVKFVFSSRLLLAVMTLDLFAVLLGGATYMLPFVAKDILHVGATGFGLLRAAPSVGAVLMAILIAHQPPMQRAGRAMLLAVAGFGAATIVFGISHFFWLSMAMLFLTGAFDNVSVVVRHTLVQLLTPNSMRGRVSAVNQVFIGASNELGGFESGLAAAWFGLVPSIVIGGIGTILVVIGTSIVFPQVLKIKSLQSVQNTT